MRSIPHFVGGRAVEGTSGRFGDVFDPNTGQVQARVALATKGELDAAVANAAAAQPAWAATNPQRRARVMFEFVRLLNANMDELAHLLSSEHGKVIADAKGDIMRGLEVIEFACGIPHLLKGEYTQGAGPGIDVYSMRQPLGVVAGITPFNFPAMIPMWMMGPAIASGNAFILKPSERDPSVPVRLARAADRGRPAAGNPQRRARRQGLRRGHPRPSDHQGRQLRRQLGHRPVGVLRAGASGKRVQAMGGAKNHGIVLPDADLDQAVADIIGAAYGSAGERCMALPVVVPVGEKTAIALREKLVTAIGGLRVGISTDKDAHYGPWSAPPTRRGSKATSRWASTRARSWWSTAAASPCRATRTASSSARPCSTTSSRP
jgi:malonate-semialdehyde dehydrogenase (acetylating)/methylmalonate-semialdehyde dehydrogenase